MHNISRMGAEQGHYSELLKSTRRNLCAQSEIIIANSSCHDQPAGSVGHVAHIVAASGLGCGAVGSEAERPEQQASGIQEASSSCTPSSQRTDTSEAPLVEVRKGLPYSAFPWFS